jgi:hypothetical protein
MGLKDDLHRLTRFSNFRKQVASKTNEQNESIDNILDRVIMQASMAPKKSRSARRRKSFFSSSKGTISTQKKQLQESGLL